MTTPDQKQQPSGGAAVVLDASAENWVYRYAPLPLQGYLKLARLDRPVGVWLLLWPCWWSLLIAPSVDITAFDTYWTMLLFAVGALAMRGAGCTYNDIVDRDIDAQVARTAKRPIPAGEVSTRAAVVFLVFQALIGLVVLLQFNLFAIQLGIASLALVLAYPFMKRITWWPQLWLGLTFNWGALMGWAVAETGLGLPPMLLYAGCVFWTLGYDTIYAHQDREDDALIGVKSSARRLGRATRPAVAIFYGLFALFLAGTAYMAFDTQAYGIAFLPVFYLLAAQVAKLDIDDPDGCLRLFKSNIALGGLICVGFAIPSIIDVI